MLVLVTEQFQKSDLAAEVRDDELRDLVALLSAGREKGAIKSLDERGGAQELVRQEYSGRYPFELLQNANDAAGETGTRGRAHFLLTDSALLVADNGSGFGEAQIRAICSLGRSSKGPGTSVGHKGLGFKSVGEITDGPQIISEQVSFQFHGERIRELVDQQFRQHGSKLPGDTRLPIYAFPVPIEESDLGEDAASVRKLRESGFRTVIRLPLRTSVDREQVAGHLREHLHPRLLLFLNGVDHLVLEGTDNDFSAAIERETDGGTELARLTVTADTATASADWLIYRGATEPSPDVLAPLGDAWLELEQCRYAVAVPLTDDGVPRTDRRFPLHVYFPTEETPGLSMAIHAEWVLTMDRRHIAATPEAMAYNQMLLEAVVDFLGETVMPSLLDISNASASAVAAIIPTRDTAVGNAATELRNLWTNSLSGLAFLPCVDGSLRSPEDVRLLPSSVSNHAAAQALASLDVDRTLRADVEDVLHLGDFLAGLETTQELTIDGFLATLRAPTKKTADEYYSFLVGWRASGGRDVLAALRQAPCVLTTNDSVVTPAVDSVFFPRVQGDGSIPDDIPVPIAQLPQLDGAQEFFKDLGVKDFEWRDLIRDFLIKILEDPEADPDLRERALRGLRAYQEVSRGGDDLVRVLARVLVPTRTADGSARAMRPAGQAYFSREWTGSHELEVIYGPFGETEFLDVPVSEDADERASDFGFYQMLGVVAHPRIERAQADTPHDYPVGSRTYPHRGPLLAEWMETPEVQAVRFCPEGNGHPQTQHHKLSQRLDRHEKLIASQDPARLLALWTQLAGNWSSIYLPATKSIFHCGHSSGHHVDRDRTCESLFAYLLRTGPWVPTELGGATIFVRPSEAWIDGDFGVIRNRVSRISVGMYEQPGAAGMAQWLRVTDSARLRVPDILALLSSLADEADTSGTVERDVLRAAKWSLGRLDEALRLHIEPHPDPASVRVLASHAGVKLFTAQPPFAEDTFLRETWERELPVLDADSRLTRVGDYLSLTKLDKVVKSEPFAYNERMDSVRDAIEQQITEVKPLIMALATKEREWAVENVRPRLRDLRLVVCERLELVYTHDSIEARRRDATCYIHEERERRGRRPRTIGTAYLELNADSGHPDWFAFGRQLAQHIDVASMADAITMMLSLGPAGRDQLMVDRNIDHRDIVEAAELLDMPLPEDDTDTPNVLDAILDSLTTQTLSVVPLLDPHLDPVTEKGFVIDAPADVDDDQPAEPVQPPAAPPPISMDAVAVVDAMIGGRPESRPISPHPPGGGQRGGGHVTTAPTPEDAADRTRIGKKGERLVFELEKKRMLDCGLDPAEVEWVSKDDELAPYDIRSVRYNQTIYIEVKTTVLSDPMSDFGISKAELVEAGVHRSRYFIYRVSAIDTAAPTVMRIQDPLALIDQGRGELYLAKARMQFFLSTDGPADEAGATNQTSMPL